MTSAAPTVTSVFASVPTSTEKTALTTAFSSVITAIDDAATAEAFSDIVAGQLKAEVIGTAQQVAANMTDHD